MKVIVFGGSGFLGSHLADALTSDGYKVTIFDKKKSQWLQKNQKFISGDILDKKAIDKVLKGFDFVYHLAGISDIEEASLNPLQTIETNIIGSTNILDACLKAKVKRFLFASSIYVYSQRGSFYRATKQSVETIIEEYNKNYGLEYTILRFGSLYGTRAQEWNSLKKFVKQALKEGKIEYSGNGTEKREYIHIQDAAKLSIDALKPEFKNECLTITGTQILSSKETMQMIAEIIGKDIKLKFTPNNLNYKLSHYSITPYKYTPKQGRKLTPNVFIDLGQGILDLIEEYENKKL